MACPLNADTRGLLSAERIGRTKRGVLIVNVGRGAVIDQAGLVRALESRHVAGAALDVFEQEPLTEDASILSAPNTLLFPHTAGYVDETVQRCIDGAAEACLAIARGEVPQHIVNPEVLNRPEFLAKLVRLSARL